MDVEFGNAGELDTHEFLAGSASFDAGDTLTHVLRRTGDFALWGPALHHRAF